MTYMVSLEKALKYIEAHLNEEIDLDSIALEAGYSLYHFHRIFKGLVGDSMKDYIRKRRMTEAAKELVHTDTPIVEIGLKYGYESREAFSRAFEKVYGKNPSQVRKGGLLYFIREPMSPEGLQYEYKLRTGDLSPSYCKLPERFVVGKRLQVRSDGSNLKEIPLFWQHWNAEGELQRIPNRKHGDACMGICIYSERDVFDYMIGCEVGDQTAVPEGMELFKLEPQYYAVFQTVGHVTESVQKTWDYIYSVWLNQSGQRHAGTHDIEYYYWSEQGLCAELYVPINEDI